MVNKIYSSRGTQKVHIKGRGIGAVLLNTKLGGATALVNGASPPDMEGNGMMSRMEHMGRPAMKKMKKSEMVYKNQVAHVKAERDVLVRARNSWIVDLKYSF
jgi:hypothetical protein